MALFTRVASVLSFSTLQILLSKFISLINFAIVVRLLTTEEVGIIGLAGGYIALVAFVLVLPEAILIRDFKRIQGRLHEYISSFVQFNVLRGVVLFALALPVVLLMQTSATDPRLGTYFLLLLVSALLNTLTGPFRESFYGYYRQARITMVDLLTSILLLASMVFLYYSRDVITYGMMQVASSAIGVGLWYWTAHTQLKFNFTPKINLQLAFDSLKGFSFWNHLSGSIIRLVYQVDIVILGLFVALNGVGSYSVALTIANVFFLFPQMVQKVLTLSFSQLDDKSLRNVFGTAVRYNTLLSIFQFIGFVLFGWVLIAILSPQEPVRVLEYGVYLTAGVALINISRPWVALCLARVDPRKLFLELYLIPSLLAVPIYYYAASTAGALGVAQANVIAFGIVSAWTIVYATRRVAVRPNLFHVANFERNAAGKLSKLFFAHK